jgi:class 3 adenylate cyclase/TM2 domain-containing membrane protein YozV
MKKLNRRLAAIMFTDMVGYSALMQKDEALAGKLRDRHREVFVRNTDAYGGEILQYYGDGTLSIYPSASAAVECAIEIQRELKREPAVSLRIGIHTGDISYGEEDVFGDGVNIASRIEHLCVPGGIFISGKVYDDIKNVSSIQTRSIGPFKLKNIGNEIEIVAVTNEGITAPPPGYHYKISPLSRRPPEPPQSQTPPTPQPLHAHLPPQPIRGRKKKFIAGILAFFFGIFGAHRFYLGQRQLGLLYLGLTLIGMFIIKDLAMLIPIVAIVSFVDAVILFSMPRPDFDHKYNEAYQEQNVVKTQKQAGPKWVARPQAPPQKSQPQKSPAEEQFDVLWKKAMEEYREYDYGEAISALNDAIKIKANDPEAHFLLACCHSINEDVGHALDHLELAVVNRLEDQERIQSHIDLAYLRMQPQYETFVKNGYRQIKELPEPEDELLLTKTSESPDLLEQLQQLQKLREDGQLTEIEYISMVRKLNR